MGKVGRHGNAEGRTGEMRKVRREKWGMQYGRNEKGRTGEKQKAEWDK